MVLLWGVVQRDVLPDEYTDANAAEVEAVQELVDLRELGQPAARLELALELRHADGHDRHHVPALVGKGSWVG